MRVSLWRYVSVKCSNSQNNFNFGLINPIFRIFFLLNSQDMSNKPKMYFFPNSITPKLHQIDRFTLSVAGEDRRIIPQSVESMLFGSELQQSQTNRS